MPRMIVAGGAVMGLVYLLFLWFGLWVPLLATTTSSLMPTDTAAIDQEVEVRIKQLQLENENLKRDQLWVILYRSQVLSLNKPSLYQFHLSPEL